MFSHSIFSLFHSAPAPATPAKQPEPGTCALCDQADLLAGCLAWAEQTLEDLRADVFKLGQERSALGSGSEFGFSSPRMELSPKIRSLEHQVDDLSAMIEQLTDRQDEVIGQLAALGVTYRNDPLEEFVVLDDEQPSEIVRLDIDRPAFDLSQAQELLAPKATTETTSYLELLGKSLIGDRSAAPWHEVVAGLFLGIPAAHVQEQQDRKTNQELERLQQLVIKHDCEKKELTTRLAELRAQLALLPPLDPNCFFTHDQNRLALNAQINDLMITLFLMESFRDDLAAAIADHS